MTYQLVSVICTVKNGQDTIVETIESVINQTYEKWELIVVDDGSTDNTKSILEQYAKIDDRIKPHYTSGIGRGKALNRAIELSSGEYIANLDADDVFHPQKLEIQLETFKTDDRLFIVATKSVLIYKNKSPQWKEVNIEANNKEKIGIQLLKKNILNHSSIMMHKKKLDDIGRYDEKRKSQFDYELWLRAYNYNLKIVRLNIVLTAKRIHSNQSFENKKRLKYLFNSSILQLEYILLNKKFYLIPLVPIRLILGLLPFKFRQLIKKIIKIG